MELIATGLPITLVLDSTYKLERNGLILILAGIYVIGGRF